jgi:Zn-dependent protease with chaperone function
MDVLLRCVVLALGAFGLTHVAVSLSVACRWTWHRPAGPPAQRADALLRLQLIPTVAATVVCVFAAIGLFRFESRDGDEVLGWLLWATGAFGAALLALMAWRVGRMWRQTSQLRRAWLSEATPMHVPDAAAVDGAVTPAFRIDTGFPVVAVIGVWRPRLVVDVLVLNACSREELAAIVAHERGHVRRLDNLRRFAFAAVPGPWGSRDLPHAWRDATEEAADDLAAASDQNARFHLAAALLRVSRLAPADAARWHAQLPASALYRGETIERRVRRLVDGPLAPSGARRPWTAMVGAVLLGLAFAVQRQLHDAMEVIVAVLP